MGKWKTQGERMLLMIDSNEDLNSGILQKGLMKLGLSDLVRERSGMIGPATHLEGKSK